MITLPNNCKCSDPNVFPANWKRAAASVKDPWYISYYFYDAVGARKKVIVKGGVNRYKTAEERRQAMEILLDELLHLLKNQGANPITNTITRPLDQDPSFIEAMEYAAGKMKVAASTASDIKSMLTYVQEHAKRLRLAQAPVKEIKRKNIVDLINSIESPHKFNKYRSYLSMLFEVLVEAEMADDNPCLGIKKRKTIKKLREVLTPEERKLVKEHLKTNYYTFYIFMEIFYHSGGREIELLRVKVKDVDLPGQRFKVTVLKGQQPVEMWRTIKDTALPFWLDLLKHSHPNMYIFSRGLKPGPQQIRREQITRRWNHHIVQPPGDPYYQKSKKGRGRKNGIGGLGINKTFYGLKHLAAMELKKEIGRLATIKHMGHTDGKMLDTTYDVNFTQDYHELIKKATNNF